MLSSGPYFACEGQGYALLPFNAPNPPSSPGYPMVQRSRSFGCAETVSKHLAARVARLRMALRSGEMDVDRERLPQT
jgi:hypothetical protein